MEKKKKKSATELPMGLNWDVHFRVETNISNLSHDCQF